MQKDIRYNGLTETPADYECPDGDLATSYALLNEKGALHPIMQPKEQFTSDYEPIYIHQGNGYSHVIAVNGNSLYWANRPETNDALSFTNLLTFGSGVERYEITSVGNTLLVLASDGMHYLLWNNGAYKNLGMHLPELPISFGLQGELVTYPNKYEGEGATDDEIYGFYFQFTGIDGDHLYDEFTDDNKTKISDQVLAKVNKFIADNSTNAGKFIFPFFVRYAYRLYDQTLTMHSAPVLMVCSSDVAPDVIWTNLSNGGGGDYSEGHFRIFGVRHDLDYAVIDSAKLAELKQWSDIVKSVDIFISKPIYTYDQSGKCQRFSKRDEYDSYCICKHVNQDSRLDETYPKKYQVQTFNKMYAFTYPQITQGSVTLSYPNGRIELPRKTDGQVTEEIRNCSLFYMLKQFTLDELQTQRTKITIDEGYLGSLVNREYMTDDYDSHDTLIAKYGYVYNSRLNAANVKKMLYNGYNTGALTCYTNGFITKFDDEYAQPNMLDDTYYYEVYFFIRQEGREFVVKGDGYYLAEYANGLDSLFLFLYYSNKNAYKAVVYRALSSSYLVSGTYKEFLLQPHDGLNGAFYFGGWDDTHREVTRPTVSSDRTLSLPNKLYVSEVNNPFLFTAGGIKTVGTGEILGIRAANKALIPGQIEHGQYPLYAFTNQGVWALEVEEDGTYKPSNVITFDVCLSSESIAQLDTSVVFATARGIMMLSGSNSTCISEDINSEVPFAPIAALEKDDMLRGLRTFTQGMAVNRMRFLDYVKGCRMVYDYTHQRVVFFYIPEADAEGTGAENNQATEPLGTRYAYVFSLESKRWGIMPSEIKSTLNGYPQALVVKKDGNTYKVLDLCDETDTAYVPEADAAGTAAGTGDNGGETAESGTASGTNAAISGLVVTRPMKLEAPDVLKTIDTVITRGNFAKGHVKTILYGSRDLQNWMPIWSSVDHYLRGFRGTPYKYFRLVLLTSLDKEESIFSSTVQFTHRQTDVLR